MDDEIKQKLLEYLNNTQNFILDQAPDVVKQVLIKTRDPTAEGIVFECIKDWNERIKSDE